MPLPDQADNITHSAPPDGTTLYIANAGMVLLHPFLPRFFEHLGLLSGDDANTVRMIGSEKSSRAVHLLQYLVDQRCDAPEPELALNKLLCGLPPDTPVARAITPDADELAFCDALLNAVIGNWHVLGGISITALRETFLQREGKLLLRDGKWTLKVSRKTVDVLLEQMPWGVSLVRYPWMPLPLSVVW